MLVTVEGIYQDGQIHLNDKVPFKDEPRVIVTFLKDPVTGSVKKRLRLSDFSFKKTREALKNYQESFSDTVIEERRESL